MAEMNTSVTGPGKGPGVKRTKKLSTRIDLTPMVDLGFLLITFFMYTTSLAQPKTMEIAMPYKGPGHSDVKESTALTLLISKNHLLYSYEGIGNDSTERPLLKPVSISKGTEALRAVILAKKADIETRKQRGTLLPSDDIVVLIKPDSNSTFLDLVNVFDEMTISDVKVHPKVDITDRDRELIHLTKSSVSGN